MPYGSVAMVEARDHSTSAAEGCNLFRLAHRDRPVQELEGTWVNADCPWEQYVVEGLKVIRTDIRSTQRFTLHWDHARQRLQWGTHGRLYLEWLADDAIAWMPESSFTPPQAAPLEGTHHVPPPPPASRVWRWKRATPSPPQHHPRVVEAPSAAGIASPSVRVVSPAPAPLPTGPSSGGYGPVRRARGSAQNWEERWPYPSTGPSRPSGGWRAASRGESSNGGDRHGRSNAASAHHHGHRRHREHSQHHHGDHHYDHRGDRHRGREYNSWRSRGGFSNEASATRMPCGLTPVEVFDLLSRDITPEDYDMLLRLDQVVVKPTASTDDIEALPSVAVEEFQGGHCTVCISNFEDSDSVAVLPCKHQFHRECITRWLAECRKTCPLCGEEAMPSASSASE
eukprot:TRINITY_DN6394_c0_g1_i1.p1 TRINITY_DN6394_c0_g1~~TRINITY_DN6394_c0_g1_i1.p1  ORF type:complete len:397 (-),score=53.51 TRINITY_DN6394_c0_g1_i1:203-1393(-)